VLDWWGQCDLNDWINARFKERSQPLADRTALRFLKQVCLTFNAGLLLTGLV
jgi:hypothetical protein